MSDERAARSEGENRIADRHVDLDYQATYRFFKGRANSGKDKVVQVLYQDEDPALAHARAEAEFQVLSDAVTITGRSVLDIGCGTGRLADRIIDDVNFYFGFDMLPQFVETARTSFEERGICHDRYRFMATPCNAEAIHIIMKQHRFDLLIMSGVSIYLNDEDFVGSLQSMAKAMQPGAVLYMRDPLETIGTRLTLDRFASAQLSAEYSVIYRGVDEYREIVEGAFGPLFDVGALRRMYADPWLAGCRSTQQHYLVVRRS